MIALSRELAFAQGVIVASITVLLLRATGHMVWTDTYATGLSRVTFLAAAVLVPGLTSVALEYVREVAEEGDDDTF